MSGISRGASLPHPVPAGPREGGSVIVLWRLAGRPTPPGGLRALRRSGRPSSSFPSCHPCRSGSSGAGRRGVEARTCGVQRPCDARATPCNAPRCNVCNAICVACCTVAPSILRCTLHLMA